MIKYFNNINNDSLRSNGVVGKFKEFAKAMKKVIPTLGLVALLSGNAFAEGSDCMSGYFVSISPGLGIAASTEVDWSTNFSKDAKATGNTDVNWSDATGKGELKHTKAFIGQVGLGYTFDESTTVQIALTGMPSTDHKRKVDDKVQHKASFIGGDVGFKFAIPMGWINPHVNFSAGIARYKVDLDGNEAAPTGSDFNPALASIDAANCTANPNTCGFSPEPYKPYSGSDSQDTGYYKAGFGFDFNLGLLGSGDGVGMFLGLDYQFIAAFKRADFDGDMPTTQATGTIAGGKAAKYEPLFAYNNIMLTLTLYPQL